MSCTSCSNHSQPQAMWLFSLSKGTLPNPRRAAARASSGVMPHSICCCWRSSKCKRISSSRSVSNWRRCISILNRLASSRSQFMPEILSNRLNHSRDRPDDPFELRHLDGQLFAARRSQLVVPSATVASRRAPLRGHPSLDEHPLQRWVQRSFFDLEDVIRYPLNGIGDLISMHFAGARQSCQNHQIECSGGYLVSVQITTS